MEKIVLFCLLFLLASRAVKAQDYHSGAGLKVGMAPGVTAKHYLNRSAALEGILSFRWKGANLAGLGEFHLPVFDTEGMRFYYGLGMHFGVWDSGLAIDRAASGKRFNMGVDGVVGLEYSFFHFPLSLGMDWKPNVNLITDTRLIIDEISFCARFLIR